MATAMAELSAEQQAKAQGREEEAQELARHLTAAFAEDILGMARLLVAADERHAFGQTEFDLRDIAHRLGAKALEAGLAQKKTATVARACLARAAGSPPSSTATGTRRR